MPTRGRSTASVDGWTRVPSTQTSPCVGAVSPLAIRSRVDLPAPDAPRITQNWPRGTCSDTEFKAVVPSA
ncbi:hypothetical protein FQZ97_654680 [compost metagenome]